MTLSTGVLDVGTLPDDGRPLLLLDVDGVINIFNGSQNPRLYVEHRVMGYRIKIRRGLSDWLSELVDHFIPVWATMWDDDANTELCPLLGWPSLPYIPCGSSLNQLVEPYGDNGLSRIVDRNDSHPLHHKTGPITEHVGDRPFIWVDDEITRHDFNWASTRDDVVAPTWLIKTDDRVGLERHHIDKLIKWANLIK